MLKGATIHFNFLFDESHLWIASDESHMYCLIRVTECFVTNRDQNNNGYGYGCSFVAKLNWKKKFFWKNICVFYKLYIICRKKWLKKKNLYWFFFVYWKSFIYRKWKIYISHLRNIFYPENIYSFCKKNIFWS